MAKKKAAFSKKKNVSSTAAASSAASKKKKTSSTAAASTTTSKKRAPSTAAGSSAAASTASSNKKKKDSSTAATSTAAASTAAASTAASKKKKTPSTAATATRASSRLQQRKEQLLEEQLKSVEEPVPASVEEPVQEPVDKPVEEGSEEQATAEVVQSDDEDALAVVQTIHGRKTAVFHDNDDEDSSSGSAAASMPPPATASKRLPPTHQHGKILKAHSRGKSLTAIANSRGKSMAALAKLNADRSVQPEGSITAVGDDHGTLPSFSVGGLDLVDHSRHPQYPQCVSTVRMVCNKFGSDMIFTALTQLFEEDQQSKVALHPSMHRSHPSNPATPPTVLVSSYPESDAATPGGVHCLPNMKEIKAIVDVELEAVKDGEVDDDADESDPYVHMKKHVIPFLESLQTDNSKDMSDLCLPVLKQVASDDDKKKFFSAIMSFILKNEPFLKECGASLKTLGSWRRMFVAQFIYKKWMNLNEDLAKEKFSLGDTSAGCPVIDAELLRELNVFLHECLVPKKDRAVVLAELPQLHPGRGNGKAGNLCKGWEAAKKKGMAWYSTKEEYESAVEAGISAPWVGHLVCLACMYPQEDKFQPEKLSQDPLNKGGI